ncbi:CAP domain-containing protein [Vagococcus sp.]|uniref:CAP domain-containing protein n=1 Tax=Vagococcus sp. TaxID=1933889 RepID=UPI003F98B310
MNGKTSEIQTDYKPRMVKGKKGWIVKGMIYTTLIGTGAVTSLNQDVQAADWIANSAETIKARIKKEDASYTFIEGDTFYEIGRAINVKANVLMKLNGFNPGDEYTIPIGTTIKFDGRKVTVTDANGEIKNENVLTDRAKVDPSKTFMNQLSDDTSKESEPEAFEGNVVQNSHYPEQTPHKPKQTKPTIKQPVKPVYPTLPSVDEELIHLKEELVALEEEHALAVVTLEEKNEALNETNQFNLEIDTKILSAQNQVTAASETVINVETNLTGSRADLDTIQLEIKQWEPSEDTPVLPEGLQLQFEHAQQSVLVLQTQYEQAIETFNQSNTFLLQTQAIPKKATDPIVSEIAKLELRIAELEQKIEALKLKIAQLENNVSEDTRTLEDTRLAALEMLTTLHLLADEVDLFSNAISNATLVSEIEAYLEQAKEAHQKNNDLLETSSQFEEAKEQAILTIQQLDLSLQQKETFIANITAASTLEEIDGFLNEAKNTTNDDLETEKPDIDELTEAKETAQEQLTTLILGEEQERLSLKIRQANTLNEIKLVLQEALEIHEMNLQNNHKPEVIPPIEKPSDDETTNKPNEGINEEEHQLALVKNDAFAQLKNLNLKDSQFYISQILTAQSKEDIQDILKQAKNESLQNELEDNELEASKKLEQAKNSAIEQLEKLTLKDKSSYVAQIKQAKSLAEIEALLNSAKEEHLINQPNEGDNEEEKLLALAKEDAIAQLDRLNLKDSHLYISQILTAQSKEDIQDILKQAKNESLQNELEDNELEASKKLEQAKNSAIEQLEKLTLKDKISYVTRILQARTIANVEVILNEAKEESLNNTSTNQEEEEKKLLLAKEKARAQLNQLKLKKPADYLEKIKKAASISAVEQLLNEAKKEHTLTIENEKKELLLIKNEAIEQLNSLNLKDNTTFLDQIKKAISKNEVQNVLSEAYKESEKNNALDNAEKQLKNAKSHALITMASLNLKEQKNVFEKEITLATSIEQVQKIIENAKILSKENDKKDQQKNEATLTINIYTRNVHLPNYSPRFIKSITLTVDARDGFYKIDFSALGLGDQYSLKDLSILTGNVQPGENKEIRLEVSDSTPLILDDPAQIPIAEQTFFTLLNNYRREHNLNTLKWNNELTLASKLRSKEIVTKFGHTRPNNLYFDTAIRQANNGKWIYYGSAGENLARVSSLNTGVLVGHALFNGWKNSPPHNKNMLDSSYRFFGIGIVIANKQVNTTNLFSSDMVINGDHQ